MKRRVIRFIGIVSAGAVLSTAARTLADVPCQDCGPGDHWVDNCPAGDDTMETGAVVGIDLNLDCLPDTSLRLSGPTIIRRRVGDPATHTIETEIISMSLTGGGVTLAAGEDAGMDPGTGTCINPGEGVVPKSCGVIVEEGGDPARADSSFDVYFRVDLGEGMYVYNHNPLVIAAEIDCVPPDAEYIHTTGCLPLYDDPDAGYHIANLVSAEHWTFPTCGDNVINHPSERCDPPGSACPGGSTCRPDCTCPPRKGIPTVSEWAAIGMTLLLLTGGTIVFFRKRGREAAVA